MNFLFSSLNFSSSRASHGSKVALTAVSTEEWLVLPCVSCCAHRFSLHLFRLQWFSLHQVLEMFFLGLGSSFGNGTFVRRLTTRGGPWEEWMHSGISEFTGGGGVRVRTLALFSHAMPCAILGHRQNCPHCMGSGD